MEQKVFITKTASYFPNEPVGNEEMEDYLGLIGGKPSRVKNIILRQNGIKRRFYALNKHQQLTHSNAQLVASSIKSLLPDQSDRDKIQVLTCGTSTPDQMLPSHASMVHGAVFSHPMEIYSLAGVCMTSIGALKTACMSIQSGNSSNALCCASELVSPVMLSKFFEEEYYSQAAIEKNPVIAFNKDFLRFMLSDGAACCLLEREPCQRMALEIDWIESVSYANKHPACMYMWSDYDESGVLRSWKEYSTADIAEKSVWCIKQNVKLLNEVAIPLFVDAIERALSIHGTPEESIDYVIPHISSMYFYNVLAKELEERGINLPTSKWFTNLTTVGNIGAAAIFAALDELLKTKKLEDGEKILLLVPESGRFSYGVVLLTVRKKLR